MKHSLFFILTIALTACQGKKNPLDELNPIIGDWHAQMEDHIIVSENWVRNHENSLSGTSYFINRGDTTLSEAMTIEWVNDQLQFSTLLSNEESEVVFPLKSFENGTFVFENLRNEYPQRIIYHVPTKDSLHAYIEGDLNGEPTRLDFNFKRN